ncbi:hypothetical protein COU18_02245 [Candidatus Kaiserbacteria bacterium CG10_big_fil_rev_8_21_14_0_10_51_14]|uniref:YCII-related domain-containing protein n=1 Tax=Candidatus Kaiserbacteria bacterium CG10_big_fil_rev_8_21_14_0_10_51_14 TaxID=1974610 RepID=A0A2H0UBW2_9BACT|nr:MAG: hypothetical protein COU18_02245 [Candidatus Kaiserbacteria bacterium CG10_big_fil_rev_8_21_14_0_10_51_14]
MKKYFVLYKASPEQFKKWMSMPKEEQKKGMESWTRWMEDHKADIVDSGTPLSKVKKVTTKGIEDAHNDIGGYMIVQAESHQTAAELMKDSPHFSDMEGADAGTIEVMEMPEWQQ